MALVRKKEGEGCSTTAFALTSRCALEVASGAIQLDALDVVSHILRGVSWSVGDPWIRHCPCCRAH